VIGKVGPFGIPPVVVHPDLDPNLKAQLQRVLLDMAADPSGQAALNTLMIDRFVVVEDSAYASIRQMAAILRGWDDTP
jgi:phosphonate transport system substrate-binding protein